jgi:drug/metabolite transporter (DMT)-like permease
MRPAQMARTATRPGPATGRRGLAIAAAATVISGFAVFINGYGVRAVPDATVYTTAKNLVAAVLLLLAAVPLALRSPQRYRPAGARQWAGLAAIAIIGGSVPFVLFFEGLARTSSTHAAFLQKTLVIWVALLAVPALGERLRARHVAAIALLVGGLVALEGGVAWLRPGAGFLAGADTGELLVLAATVLWAVEVMIAKRLLRQVPPMAVAVGRMGAGVLVLLGWLAITGRFDRLLGLSGRGWLWAALTGAILAGYVATWFTALSLAPAIDVTAVLVGAALITGFLNVVVKGAAFGSWTGTGMALLAVGASLIVAGPVPSGSRRVAQAP